MQQNNQTPQEMFGMQVRRIWHHDEWYYAIVDVIEVLTESPDPSAYWRNLKRQRLAKDEQAAEALESIMQFKLQAHDHRFRLTDTCNRKALLRFIQSIPSPKAEPFKTWLAAVGDERIAEVENPELALQRVREMYRAKGYNEQWIEERIKNDLVRNELTDEWQERGAQEGVEFAILTNEISKGTFDFSVQVYKQYKLLPGKANLRDHMTVLELALCSLSEATAITLHQDRDSQGFLELKRDATDAGKAGGKARQHIEEAIGRSVVSQENHLDRPQKAQKVQGKQKKPKQITGPSLFDTSDKEKR